MLLIQLVINAVSAFAQNVFF